jgi:hypothetical protein
MGEEAFQFGDKKAMRNKDTIGIANSVANSLQNLFVSPEEKFGHCSMVSLSCRLSSLFLSLRFASLFLV